MIIKDKKGLSRTGHLVFSGLLVVFGYYFLSHHIEISVIKLLWYIPSFTAGILFPDIVELPGLRRIHHRKFLHSRRMLWINLIILIPISIFMGLYINSSWFYVTSFLLGDLSHIFGDCLTSTLPR